MLKQNPQPIIDLLNEALAQDRIAIEKLVQSRVSCNKYLAGHPTIQIGHNRTVGLLGILNGICGTYDHGPKKGWGPIAADVEEKDHKRIKCFILIDPEYEKDKTWIDDSTGTRD